ncbi:MAG: hypothetical protein WBV52_01640, partial [Pseudolabrys sp.]
TSRHGMVLQNKMFDLVRGERCGNNGRLFIGCKGTRLRNHNDTEKSVTLTKTFIKKGSWWT